jgi:acylphosphatase
MAGHPISQFEILSTSRRRSSNRRPSFAAALVEADDGRVTEAREIARDVVVHGHVQGVFFRSTCLDEAVKVGVRGWARNEYDGTVAAHFEGPSDAVDKLVEWCRSGPRHAVVRRVDVSESTPEGLARFEVR